MREKVFKDAPDFGNNFIKRKKAEFSSKAEANERDREKGREYVFNEITACAYQEFEVVKINKYGARQERTLGVDRYHFYNDLPKNKEISRLY